MFDERIGIDLRYRGIGKRQVQNIVVKDLYILWEFLKRIAFLQCFQAVHVNILVPRQRTSATTQIKLDLLFILRWNYITQRRAPFSRSIVCRIPFSKSP